MPLTRADVELEVCNLIGRLMTLAGLYGSASACNGANPSLNAPLRDAFQRMGYRISDPAGLTIVDADIAALDVRALRRFMEWAELYTLQQVERDWWRVDCSRESGLAPRQVGTSWVDPIRDLKARINSRIEELKAVVKTPYQSMNVPIAMGQIRAGTERDFRNPPQAADLIPPWRLWPDGLWWYGCTSANYWGFEGFDWEGYP